MISLSTVTKSNFLHPKFFLSLCSLQKKIIFVALGVFSLLAVYSYRLYSEIRAKKIETNVNQQQQSGNAQNPSTALSTIVEMPNLEDSAVQKNLEQENSKKGQQDKVSQHSKQTLLNANENILLRILSLYLENASAYHFSLTCKFFDEIFQEPLNIASRLNELGRKGIGSNHKFTKRISLYERAGNHLKVLDLENMQIGDSELMKILTCCKNVKEIYFKNNIITDKALPSLSNNLENLSIIRCHELTNEALIALLQRSKFLRRINLTFSTHAGFLKLNDTILENLRSDLKRLILGGKPEFTTGALEIFFKRQNQLEELSLAWFDQLNNTCIANFPKTLEKLTLFACQVIAPEALIDLLKRLENLKSLNLVARNNEQLPNGVFANLSEKIIELRLNEYIFSNSDLANAFLRLKNLKRVHFNSTMIEHSALLNLSTGVEVLNIRNCPRLTNEGYILLFKRLINLQSISLELSQPDVSLHLPSSVKKLELHCKEITDETCIQLFQKLTKISKVIFISTSKISEAILSHLPVTLTDLEFKDL